MTGGSDEATTCKICWALVPRTLMTFHRAWHDDLDDDRVAEPDVSRVRAPSSLAS